MGVITPHFHCFGMLHVSSKVWKYFARGNANSSARKFSVLGVILSEPAAAFRRRVLSLHLTASEVNAMWWRPGKSEDPSGKRDFKFGTTTDVETYWDKRMLAVSFEVYVGPVAVWSGGIPCLTLRCRLTNLYNNLGFCSNFAARLVCQAFLSSRMSVVQWFLRSA
jgi:hypothetical protein